MAAFDPYAISPDFKGQGDAAVLAWQQALAKLNFQKQGVFQKYGFNNEGDLAQNAESYDKNGTANGVTASGGLTGVTNFSEFAGKDNKSGFGGFRDELNAESAALDNADNGPSRGFSGGLANQAKALAQQRVNNSQNQFTQGYNQFAGSFNQAGFDTTSKTNAGLLANSAAQSEYGANEALWQSTIPTEVAYTPGISGGGKTPIGQNYMHISGANGKPLQINQQQLNNQKPVTFGGAKSAPKVIPGRGGHAI